MSASTSVITDLGSISAFDRGPMTSVFTPPATCLSTLTYMNEMYFGHRDSYFDPACFPTGLSTSQTQQGVTDEWDLYYYSPGQCPSGWSHASTITSLFSGASDLTYALSLGSDTTAVVCCPSGFEYPTSGQGHQCQSLIISDGTLTYFSPSFIQNSYVQGSAFTTTISSGVYTIYGDGIPVWWQSSDLAAFSAASLTTSSLSSSTPSTTSTPTAISTSSPSPPSPVSSGLSTGSKVAIGVCIPLAFIAILFGLFYYFRYRQLKKQHYQGPPREEHFRDKIVTGFPKVQVMSENVHELSNERPMAEIL